MKNEAWTWRPIGDLFDIGSGKTMSAAARDGAERTPFLRTSNVFWDEIDLSKVDEMTLSERDMQEKLLSPGDLLVCEGGEIGRSAIWDGQVQTMSFQNHLHRLRPKRAGIDSRFYVYFLQSAFTQLGLFEGAGNETTIPNLSSNRLAELEVPEPRNDEQIGIRMALQHARKAIRANEFSLGATAELKRATMSELFARGTRGEPQKDTELGPVPESWDVSRLGDHILVGSGGTPSRSVARFWSNGNIPWVKTTEVKYNTIQVTEEFITAEGLANSAAKTLPVGTLLMAMYGQGVTRGKVAMLGIEATCNQACATMNRREGGKIDTRYLFHFLTHRYEEIRGMAHGGQQQNLNLDIVRDLPVAFPHEEHEQGEIVTILDAIDAKIDLHKRKKAVLEELFRALLHKLMTGEIRLVDLDLSALDPPEPAAT
jgi:type I restriction enzyme S subunit